MANETQTKTKSVTNTKIAVATAFLGFAALAAAAAGGSPASCVGDGVVTADLSQKYVKVCAGQTIEHKDQYGTVAYYYVKGFNNTRAGVVPLHSPGNPSIYAVGASSKTTSLPRGKTVSFNFPSGNSVVTHQLMYRGTKGMGYFAVSSLGPSSAMTCGDIDEAVLSSSLCPSIVNSPYVCVNKYTGVISGCAVTEDDFSNCSPLVDSSTGLNCSAVDDTPSCEDSDGGNEPYESGTVVGVNDFGSYSHSDTCLDQLYPGHLLEYACDGTSFTQFQINCVNEGKVCINGACTLPPPDPLDEAYGSPSSSLSLLPDLIVKDFTFTEADPGYGTSTIQINIIIKNIGAAPAVAAEGAIDAFVTQAFGVNADGSLSPGPGYPSSNTGVEQLDPGEELLISFPEHFPSSNLDKSPQIKIVVDEMFGISYIAESNENNNELTKSVSELFQLL